MQRALLAISLLLLSTITSSADEGPTAVLRHGKALLIGVSKYDKGWDPLPDVLPQMDSFKSELSNQFDEIRIEPNRTGREIASIIHDFLLSKDARNARLLIYYSGHGYDELYRNKTDVGFTGFITGRDTPHVQKGDQASAEAARAYAISMDEIRADLSTSTAASVLFIFDSCFAGTFFLTKSDGNPAIALPDDYVKRLLEKQARFIITAGSWNETVPAHSPIPDLIIKALHGEADVFKNNIFSAEELTLYFKQQLALRPKLNLSPQGDHLREYSEVPCRFQLNRLAAI